MTTTACDDQFSAEPEPVHQPYDVAAILRKNIADLEKELQRQREQNAAATERLREQIERVTSEWERAENDVAAARSDLQSFIDSRNELMARAEAAEAELAKLREQKPALYMAFSECGQFIRYWTRDTANLDATMAVNDFTVLEFFARPVPAAPAVAAPYVPFSDDDMAEVHQLAYELGGTDGGEYILDGEQLDQVIVKAASLFYKPVVAVPAVPDATCKQCLQVDRELREVIAGLVAIAEKKGKRQGSPNHCHQRPGIWDDDNGDLAGKPCSECAIYDRARALLQSTGDKK